MLNISKKIKSAFTLAEIFIAMVVLSVLVGVCMSFFANQKDYKREYLYYAAYQNIVKVVEAALMNETYRTGANPLVRLGDDIISNKPDNKIKIYAFYSQSGTLCKIFTDYFSTVGTPDCTKTTATWVDFEKSDNNEPAFTLTNGMDFYFAKQTPYNDPDISETSVPADSNKIPRNDHYAWKIWVDIDGKEQGKDLEYYDIMPFFITTSGKVIPAFNKVYGVRGYEIANPKLDAGANPALMTFDVVYVPDDSNVITVLNDASRHISFRDAACKSGYLHERTQYCTGKAHYLSVPAVTKDPECNTKKCTIRLVKKLKKTRL